VAIKKIFNPNITQELLEELNTEINMLATLRHPQIVLLMGIVSKPPNLCIVTDFLGKGDLFTLLHKQKYMIL
jgi:serine/threonine protein kinase